MTAQASDQVAYEGHEYALCAYSNGEPFDPKAYGYKPMMASTACWRGYVSGYAMKSDRLLLDRLHINHGDGAHSASLLKTPPPLNGVAARQSEHAFIGRWLFENVGLHLPYSGGLILARNFIQELYVHMGFHPAWKYEVVHELVFEQGALIEQRDVSVQMAEIRQKASQTLKPDPRSSRSAIEAWISKCFSRDYGK
jgi:hypothetical protein